MMHGGQRLPSTGVIAPVRQARSSEIESGWNLALECVPCSGNVRRPEDGSVSLCAKVGIAREHQPAMRRVIPEAVINDTGVEERIDVEVLRARADVQVATVRRQIWLRLIRPD